MNKSNSNGIFILGAALILAIGLSVLGYLLFKSNMAQSPYGMANSITVMGEGKAMVKPDMLIINLSVSELADTTEKAQAQSNEKITKVRAMLSGMNIPEDNLKSTSVNVSPEYDRSEPSGRKLLGYRSRHSMSMTITGENFGEIGGQIITEISKIGWVNVDGTSFDLKDKNAALAWAREKALEDARAKAEQLAKAGGSKLGKILTITDNTYYNMPGPIYYAKAEGMGGVAMDSAASTSLSPGETEVVVNVNVVYKIK
jgi:uncharacterized protein